MSMHLNANKQSAIRSQHKATLDEYQLYLTFQSFESSSCGRKPLPEKEICTVLQLAWKQVPTKSRSKFFASDLRITFGIHVFWAQQCATGIRLAKNGPEECQIQYFLLIFSVFWPPFSGYSAPCGFTSGHEREPHYASKSFTEVVFKVNRSRVIRHSLTFLFGKSSTKRPLARARMCWGVAFRWVKCLY